MYKASGRNKFDKAMEQHANDRVRVFPVKNDHFKLDPNMVPYKMTIRRYGRYPDKLCVTVLIHEFTHVKPSPPGGRAVSLRVNKDNKHLDIHKLFYCRDHAIRNVGFIEFIGISRGAIQQIMQHIHSTKVFNTAPAVTSMFNAIIPDHRENAEEAPKQAFYGCYL